MGKLPQAPPATKVIEYSMEEARNLKHGYLGTEHILLGLLREREGVAAQVLIKVGLNLEKVREDVLTVIAQGMEPADSRFDPLTGLAIPAVQSDDRLTIMPSPPHPQETGNSTTAQVQTEGSARAGRCRQPGARRAAGH